MKRCMCGNGETLPGYRVCADCKAARELYPHLFEGDAPDELNEEIDVNFSNDAGTGLYVRNRGKIESGASSG
jgi:hypothetical protein